MNILKDTKVGDKLVHSGHCPIGFRQIMTVTRTAGIRVFAGGYTWDRQGRIFGEITNTKVQPATKEIEKVVKRENWRRSMYDWMARRTGWGYMTDAELVRVHDAFPDKLKLVDVE